MNVSPALKHHLMLALICCSSANLFWADKALAAAPKEGTAAQIDKGCRAVSETMLDHLVKGEYAAAGRSFNNEMKTALPEAKLQQAWESLLTNFGTPEMRGEPQGKRAAGLAAIYTPLKFQRGNLVSQIACDVDGKVAGFYVVPEVAAPADATTKPSKPADPVQY